MFRNDREWEQTFLGIAHALYMNRLHVLRLTEVVRLSIEPNREDKNLEVPPELDQELKEQAINYVLTCFPPRLSTLVNSVKADWLNPA